MMLCSLFTEVKKVLWDTCNPDACVLDFEAACWLSLKENFPDIELHGYTFHYSKAVYNKVVSIGLAISYVQDNDVNPLIKCLFCLPYLPHRDIIPVFNDLAAQVDSENNEKLKELFQYVRSTRLQSSIWRPRNISAYLRLVRTNNDLECYHNRLNKR